MHGLERLGVRYGDETYVELRGFCRYGSNI